MKQLPHVFDITTQYIDVTTSYIEITIPYNA